MTPEQRAARRAADLHDAVDTLTLAGAVGLAIRDHRRRLGLSQRAYAAMRTWSASRVARLESDAGRSSLDDVVGALDGTGFGIALVHVTPEGSSPAQVVEPCSWRESELVARVRGGSRRFPAHHDVQAVDNPPSWWWHREFFVRGLGNEPKWYARRPLPLWDQDLMGPVVNEEPSSANVGDEPDAANAADAAADPANAGGPAHAARVPVSRRSSQVVDAWSAGSQARPADDAVA